MFDKLVIALVSPLGTALVLGVLALVLALWRPRLAWLLGVLGLAWLLVWSLPVASHALRGTVEGTYPAVPMDSLPRAQAIVVLGGGLRPAERPGQPPNMSAGADRVWHGARLYRAGKAPLVLLSGGSDPQVSVTSEAQAMRGLLADLGVSGDAVLLEGGSLNTRENARFTAALLKPRGVKDILLVTSALHMRRSVALFEAQGFKVIPAATDHEARRRFSAVDWLPSSDALDGSARAFKEIVCRAMER